MWDWAFYCAVQYDRPVFPCHERHYKRDNDGNPHCGKSPRWDEDDLPNGFLNATTDLKQIVKRWKRWPKALIGSPVLWDQVAIDIDPRKGATLTKLCTWLDNRCGVPIPEPRPYCPVDWTAAPICSSTGPSIRTRRDPPAH